MMRSAKFKAAVMTMAAAIVAAAPRLANACATCGLSEGDHALHAYKASTLFLVASPYVSFAAIGGIAFLAYRRSQRQDRKSITK
ncbi:MAG: hypothetical protein ACREQH_00505 [Candidatus Binatus sp.]